MENGFAIEDEKHSDQIGEFETFESAIAELKRLSVLNWKESPNKAPCQNWEKCGRDYEIVEYDKTSVPWKELRRVPVLSVSAKEIRWESGFCV